MSEIDLDDLRSELSDYAKPYRAIYGAEVVDPRLRTSYERLNHFEITTAVPLLAWLRISPVWPPDARRVGVGPHRLRKTNARSRASSPLRQLVS